MFIPALSICSPSVLHWISKLFIHSIHILFLLYLLLWFWFQLQNLQDVIKISRALIKDIFLPVYIKQIKISSHSLTNRQLVSPYAQNKRLASKSTYVSKPIALYIPHSFTPYIGRGGRAVCVLCCAFASPPLPSSALHFGKFEEARLQHSTIPILSTDSRSCKRMQYIIL